MYCGGLNDYLSDLCYFLGGGPYYDYDLIMVFNWPQKLRGFRVPSTLFENYFVATTPRTMSPCSVRNLL